MRSGWVLALIIAAAAACGGVAIRARMVGTASRLNNVYNGMSKGDAVTVMGDPVRVYVTGAEEFMTYRLLKSPFHIKANDYFMTLVDGRVVGFGEYAAMVR